MPDSPLFSAGRNIAMKVPPHQYESTIAFYRDVLGLKPVADHAPAVGFEFGSMKLWIDRVESLSRSEVWLEVITTDPDAAAKALSAAGVVRCDVIEPLPPNMRAFWILNPASVVHLVCARDDVW